MGERIFEEWRVYEKLLIHDYMDHRGFFNRLQQEVQTRFSQPISILDLGCGDLSPIWPLLQNVDLMRYVGIDESDGGLTLAKGRLSGLSQSSELIKGDILAVLAGLQEQFDLIVASFSLHHYADTNDKLRVLQAAKQHLNTGGMFALIDVFSAEDETRDEYLERWIEHADGRYQVLLPEEKQLLFNHVRSRDYPVSEKTWQSLGQQSGLQDFQVLLRDYAPLNGLAIFSN